MRGKAGYSQDYASFLHRAVTFPAAERDLLRLLTRAFFKRSASGYLSPGHTCRFRIPVIATETYAQHHSVTYRTFQTTLLPQ